MLRMLSLFFVLTAFVMLFSACVSMDQTNYTYVPPTLAADKTCVKRCLHAKNACQRICRMKNSKSCKCVVSFNTCYAACGGQVIAQTTEVRSNSLDNDYLLT